MDHLKRIIITTADPGAGVDITWTNTTGLALRLIGLNYAYVCAAVAANRYPFATVTVAGGATPTIFQLGIALTTGTSTGIVASHHFDDVLQVIGAPNQFAKTSCTPAIILQGEILTISALNKNAGDDMSAANLIFEY